MYRLPIIARAIAIYGINAPQNMYFVAFNGYLNESLLPPKSRWTVRSIDAWLSFLPLQQSLNSSTNCLYSGADGE